MIKILLVEDNKEISQNITEFFKGEYDITPVYNGQDAIDYIDIYSYDIAILDLMLPDISGMSILNYISKKGYNQEFTIGKKVPLEANTFECSKSGHGFKASMITVPEITPKDVSTVYIIYTHAPLTAKKRTDFQKNADAYVGKGYWQKIDINAWKGGSINQQHCLSASNLDKIYYGNGNFGSQRWGEINKEFKLKPKEYCAVAIYDAIGITASLNTIRNIEAFKPMYEFMGQSKNAHKVQTINIIDNIEKTVKDNYIGVKTKELIQTSEQIKAHSRLDQSMRNRLEAARAAKDWNTVKIIEKQIAETEQKRKENLGLSYNLEKNQKGEQGLINKAGIEKGKVAWQKCAKQLNLNAISNFRAEIDSISKNGHDLSLKYTDDHYNWLTSQNLLNGLFSFDDSEVLQSGKLPDNSNGFIFHAVIMDLMYGMNFVDKGKKLINSWVLEKKVNNSNLYLRAYCFNNAKLIQSYNQIFTSDDTAKSLLDYSKQSFTAFVGADAAFDEWLSKNEGKTYLKARDFKVFDKLFYWMSLILNSAFQQFSNLKMNTVQINQIGVSASQAMQLHVSRLLYLKLGDLAKYIPLQSFFFTLNFSQGARQLLSNNPNFSISETVNIKTKIELVLKSKSTATKNRILAIVGILEVLNFYFQHDAWKKDAENKPEVSAQLAGSSMALFAVVFEAIGESFQTKGMSVKSAAFRIFAGGLGTMGGVIGLYVDGKNISQTDSKTLKLVLIVRLGASLLITIGQFGILASAVAPHLGSAVLKNVTTKLSQHAVMTFLMSARVIAGLNLITLSLVAVEIALKKWVLDDALEDWCQKTPFRKSDSKEKPWKDATEEYQEFAKAVVSL